MNLVDRLRQKLNIGNELYRAALAELFCTGFLLFGGTCVNAQFILSQRRTNEWVCVAVGWGIVLLFAVQMGFRISGAHLNPAVSFFLFTQGKINALRFIVFVVAQNIGAFLGALSTFIVYYDAISHFDNRTRYVSGPRATANIFATYPQPHLSTFGGIIDQVAGTAVLCLGVAAITDRRNRIPPFLQPSFIGLLLTVLGMMVAMNAGYAINPARDFGPRLFTLCAGYGWRVFSYRNYKWFWIPIICPMIGAVIGAWLYEFFIGFHIPDDPETSYIHKKIFHKYRSTRHEILIEKKARPSRGRIRVRLSCDCDATSSYPSSYRRTHSQSHASSINCPFDFSDSRRSQSRGTNQRDSRGGEETVSKFGVGKKEKEIQGKRWRRRVFFNF
ncbi:hypothetical protein Y032_0084g1767 [Ancylostoma ceylanicum]|uniref:Aquaporin-9 n=1 Tax=Ancylostoma ceylanicum TaxID=53326 RepID=A0A016TQ09_9BILA|nr:hypothetical protein Y032_0084g1767 [Ancylostoma ceylanicum]